jgi:hypothetical protein
MKKTPIMPKKKASVTKTKQTEFSESGKPMYTVSKKEKMTMGGGMKKKTTSTTAKGFPKQAIKEKSKPSGKSKEKVVTSTSKTKMKNY